MEKATPANWKNKCILIAEDMEMNYTLLYILLDKLNIQSLWAENGEIAVEKCKTNPNIDLVLMDVRMPVMDGIEATRKIKEFKKDLPVLAITAYAEVKTRQHCMEAGCDGFMEKPITFEHLQEALLKHLK